MKATLPLRIFLIASGSIAVVLGTLILFATRFFYAGYGIDLGGSPNLLNEIRAPGLAMIMVGLVIGLGGFLPRLARTATIVSAGFYLTYGLSRWISIALDGMPDTGLIVASMVELLVGALSLAVLRSRFAERGAATVAEIPVGKP